MSKVERITRPHMRSLIEPYGLAEAVHHGTTLTLAGQIGMTHDHHIVEGGLKAQALQAFCNIRDVIAFAGADPANLVHLTWYLAPSERSFMEDALDVTMARNEVFPGLVAGSTAVRVQALLTPEILIEIQGVCAL